MNWNRCPDKTGTAVRNEPESVSGMTGIPKALYEGNAPSLINERLRQLETELDAARARLDEVGTSTAPIPAAELAQGISGALAAGAVDLIQLRGLIGKVVLPVSQKEPLELEAFGSKFNI